MRKNLWRMIVALVISSGCFIGTVVWYESGKTENGLRDKKPVARLNNSTNEVQRKPKQRVIWESVNKNDEFFPGEAVRTAPNAEAQLYFLKSHTTVHLDPDSLVVLEENEKGLSLDFLQGNMFVQSNQGEQTGEGLTVKTGNGEIKMKSADMSLSKNKNGNVNLEVHRGEAELSQGSKKTALNKEKSAELSESGVNVANDRMQVLRPQAGDTLYLNLSKGEKLDLGWTPIATGYSVSFEIGKTRSALEKIAGISAPGDSGQYKLPSKPGRWYMRLVATSSNPKQPPLASTVIPFIIEPKAAPSLVEPRQEAVILKTDPEAGIAFKWLGRHKFISQVIEIATDPLFKKISAHESLDGDVNSYSGKLADGAYFWRVTGFLKLKDKNEGLSSPAGKFTVLSKWEVKPPSQLSPPPNQHLSFFDVQKSGVPLKWQAPQGVERFKVVVERKVNDGWKEAHQQETETSSVRVADLKPGTYQWKVASIDSKGGEAKVSAPQQFTIEEMPKIEWVDAAPLTEHEFQTPTPSLKGQWKPLASQVATYRFKIASEEQGLDGAEWQLTKQSLFDISVPTEGRYQVQVEALNTKGQLLGQSDIKNFLVKRRPLLPAPQWSANTPEVLKTDGKGNLTFGWEQVDGAQHYLMILENTDGKVIDQREVSRNTASLNRLKPGEYQVHLKSVDGFKRPGLDGKKRKIEVPATSDIRAPRIKAMKVK